MKNQSSSFRYGLRSIHVSAALAAIGLVALWVHWYGNPFQSHAADETIAIRCSSERGSNPCSSARLGVRGDWISNGESHEKISSQKNAAWIEYYSTDDTELTVTGATLIDRGAFGNDILDGHFEFDGNPENRYPQRGGIGALTAQTNEVISFPSPISTNRIRFVIDDVSEGTVDVGLAEFRPYILKPGVETLVCDGKNINPLYDQNHCGSCANVCGTTQWCSLGKCRSEQVVVMPITLTGVNAFALGTPLRTTGTANAAVSRSSAPKYSLEVQSSDGVVLAKTPFDVPVQEAFINGQWTPLSTEYPVTFDVTLNNVDVDTTTTVYGTHTYSSESAPTVTQLRMSLHSRQAGPNRLSPIVTCSMQIVTEVSSQSVQTDPTEKELVCQNDNGGIDPQLSISTVVINPGQPHAGEPVNIHFTVGNRSQDSQEFFPSMQWGDGGESEVLVPGGVIVPGAARFVVKDSSGAALISKSVNKISQ